MTPKFEKAQAAALAIINAGEATKSQQKAAFEELGRAYDEVKRAFADTLLADRTIANWDNLYYGAPDLHNWKPRHDEAYAGFPMVSIARALADLRAEVKEVSIVTKAPKGPTAEETIKAAAMTSFKALDATRRSQFDWAKAIFDEAVKANPEFPAMGVTARPTYCSNQHGTEWVRVDWYVYGERMPFQVILAAAQQAKA